MAKRLFRSKTNRKISGVCGGLASYFDADPTIVRLIFLFSIFLGTLGFWVYLIMIIIVPVEEGKQSQTEDGVKGDK